LIPTVVIRLQKEEAGTWSIIIHNYSSQKSYSSANLGHFSWTKYVCSNTTHTHTHTHTQNVENLIIRCGKICQSHVSQSGIIKPSVNFPASMRIVLVCVGVFWEPIAKWVQILLFLSLTTRVTFLNFEPGRTCLWSYIV
jgi:hypothetical protein